MMSGAKRPILVLHPCLITVFPSREFVSERYVRPDSVSLPYQGFKCRSIYIMLTVTAAHRVQFPYPHVQAEAEGLQLDQPAQPRQRAQPAQLADAQPAQQARSPLMAWFPEGLLPALPNLDIPAQFKEAMGAQLRQLQAQRQAQQQHLQQLHMQVEQQRYLQADQHVGPPLPPGQAAAVNRPPGARLVADHEQSHPPAPFHPAFRDYDLEGLNPQVPRVNQVQPQILPVQRAVDELLPIPGPSGTNSLPRYHSVNMLPVEAQMQVPGPGPAAARPASPLRNPRPAGGLE